MAAHARRLPSTPQALAVRAWRVPLRTGKRKEEATHCCWRLSCREHRVSQPGNGHLWLRSPVWTRAWRARWPPVVKARSHWPQV